MRLLRLLAGLLVIALAVGAQDPAATDYYDYYDDPTADVASPPDASAAGLDQGASAPAKEGEEALADDPVTDPTVTTTTAASTTEGRRKLVSLKSAKIGRSRGEARQTTEATAVAEGSPAATPEAESGAGGRRFGGSTLARSGIQRTRSNSRPSATQPESENAAEASPATAAAPTRSRFRPSARSEPAATSTDETQGSSSNRFQPRRSFRPSSSSSSSSSSDAPAEEASDKPAPSRFRHGSRSSFRPSNSRAVTESTTPSTEGETDAPHRFGTARRGRGNSRGGSAFQPSRSRTEQSAATPEEEVVEGGEEEVAEAAAAASDPSRPSSRRLSERKFRGPPIIRKTQHIRRPLGIPNATSAPTTTTSAKIASSTTSSSTATTTTTTTTETPTTSVLVLQESTTESVSFEKQTESPVKIEDMTNMNDKEGNLGVMNIKNMDDMTKIEDMAGTGETIPLDDMTGLNGNTEITNMDEETNMDMKGNTEDMAMLEERKGVDEVTEKAKILRNEDATSSMDEMPITDEILQDNTAVNDHQTETKPIVFRPIPVRRTTTEAAAETSTEPVLARTEPPVIRQSRRGSSKYSPPKPPSHPIVETTQAPAPSSADIFEAPLSDAVKSQSRVTSRARAPSSRESNANTVSNGPTPFVQQAVDIEEDSTSSKFPRPSYGPSDIQFQGGEVKITEIGTVEDTPVEEVRQILGGLGSRRRGLARPSTNDNTDRQKGKGNKLSTTEKPNLKNDYDYYYDY